MDNYEQAAKNAKKRFLTYEQDALIRKFHLPFDEDFLYPTFLGAKHRLNRTTGDLQRLENGNWLDANSFQEVLTLLDLLCDSREDRHLSGKWLGTQNFGHQFHTSLLESSRDPLATEIDHRPEDFQAICRNLGGEPANHGDLGYDIPVFEDLKLRVCFWFQDEDFPAQLRFFWDENALMYLKYETMHYAQGVLRDLLARHLQQKETVVQ